MAFATCSWSSDPHTKCIFSKASALIQATVYKHLINAEQSERLSSIDLTQPSNCVSTVEIKNGERWHERYVWMMLR
ncbi:unnamed protein product [Brassica oleracea]